MQKNKINIIFLDVDGVLNSRAYLNNHKDPEDEIDMRAVERLAKIYRQCNCKIVLSSSSRELCGDEMKAPHSMYKYLESCLAKYGMTIMDVTPMILSNRPEEIDAWLADNKDLVKNYVSLDDDFDEEHYESFGLGGHLVKTDFFVNNESEGGLQEQHVKKAKKILKEEA